MPESSETVTAIVNDSVRDVPKTMDLPPFTDTFSITTPVSAAYATGAVSAEPAGGGRRRERRP